MKYLLIICFTLLGIHTQTAQASMVIKYVDRGPLDARHAYKFELIRLILDETRAEFGDYTLEPYRHDPGAKRQSLLLSQGDQVNLFWSSPGTVIANADVIPVPIDILRGLLGYRVCLINSDNAAAFDKVTSPANLNNIRIGQGVGWADLDIYTFNNIPIVPAPTFEGLFNMLSFNRFDCLALGADEVVFTYHEKKIQMPNLELEKHVMLYYEYPVYFYVSAKHPEIARRVEKGLKKLVTNGVFNRLFERYFRKDLEELNLKSRRIICLKTPYPSLHKQCQHLELLPALNGDELFDGKNDNLKP